MTPASQNRRLWIALGVGLVLLVVIPAWFLVISPVRSTAATLRADTATVEVQNAAIAAQTAELRRKAESRDELVASLDHALSELPWEPKLPEFSAELTKHADARGVEVTSISVGASTTPGDPASTSVDPATTVQAIPITIVSTGSAVDQLYFLREIQAVGPRRALVTATAIVPTKEGSIERSSTMTVQLTVFSAPVDPTVRAELKEILGITTPE